MSEELQEIEYMKDNKQLFLEQLTTKIVEENRYDSQLKDFLEIDFLGTNFFYLFNHIIETFRKREKISKEFLSENYGYVDSKTSKSQAEIVIQLKEMFYEFRHNLLLQKYSEDRRNGKKNAFENHVKSLQKLNGNMAQVSYLSTHDEDAMINVFQSISNKNKIILSGNQIFDGLEPEKGQLIGVLGSTGDGKSVIIQAWHAYCAKRNYKIAHFTMELSDDLFIKRIVSALGLVPFTQIPSLNYNQQVALSRKMATEYKKMDIVTLGHGRVTLSKVEKILQQNLHNNTPVDVLFVDYVQLLKEDFNPMTSEVSKGLKELAQLYNVLIVMGIQTNNDGRVTEEAKKSKEAKGIDPNTPPDIDHIKFVKGIADDCDVIIALRGISMSGKPNFRRFKIVTRKHRNGIKLTAEVEVDLNRGKWFIKFCDIEAPRIESYQDFDLDELDELIEKPAKRIIEEALPSLYKKVETEDIDDLILEEKVF